MAAVCKDYKKWVEEQVEKPVEEWVEKTEQKCKKRKWYDPRRWLCWLVTTFVKDSICLAHEVSHACGLWHAGDQTNLANHICGGTKLKGWQVEIVRNSRHVTFL